MVISVIPDVFVDPVRFVGSVSTDQAKSMNWQKNWHCAGREQKTDGAFFKE